MVRRSVAISIALMALAPHAGAAKLTTADPARDVAVTMDGALVPVDSIDIVDFVVRGEDNVRRVTIHVADMTRRGVEDRLFVHSAHAMRLYGYTEIYEDQTGLLLLALQIDEREIEFAAYHIHGQGATDLTAKVKLNAEDNAISWRLAEPFAAPTRLVSTAFTALTGCDDFDTCEPPTPKIAAIDVAPNDHLGALAVLTPEVWWNDLLPEEDGRVPGMPVSLAKIANP